MLRWTRAELLVDRADGVGQQALEAEGGALLARERGALVVHGVAQQPLAAVRDVDERPACVVLLQAIRFHRKTSSRLRPGIRTNFGAVVTAGEECNKDATWHT